jgi:hypothetical protein
MYILKKRRKVVWAALEHWMRLCRASAWTTEMIPEYWQIWSCYERRQMFYLSWVTRLWIYFFEQTQEENLNKEMQRADEYASKYKRVNLYIQRWLSAPIKMEDDGNSMPNVSRRKFKCLCSTEWTLLNF